MRDGPRPQRFACTFLSQRPGRKGLSSDPRETPVLLSIITPTLNRRTMLAEALASVAAQRRDNVEHIVVDGGSTDGTLEMLAAHPHIKVLQDRRRGLYDAINQGIDAASGAVIGLLNSDDLYAPGIFEVVEAAFTAHPEADAVCGIAELFDETGTLARFDDPTDLRLDAHAVLIGNCIPNARFFRRSVFTKIGLFSTSYRAVADREFLARTMIADVQTLPLDSLAYRYRRHPGSLTLADRAERGKTFRTELLRLALNIARHPRATDELRVKARALEGRCLATLGLDRLKAGDPLGAARLLIATDGRPASASFRALVAGFLDRRRPSRKSHPAP